MLGEFLPSPGDLNVYSLPKKNPNDKPKCNFTKIYPGEPMNVWGLLTEYQQGLLTGVWLIPKQPYWEVYTQKQMMASTSLIKWSLSQLTFLSLFTLPLLDTPKSWVIRTELYTDSGKSHWTVV